MGYWENLLSQTPYHAQEKLLELRRKEMEALAKIENSRKEVREEITENFELDDVPF